MRPRLAHPITATFGLTKHQDLAPIHLLFKQLSQPRVLLILLEEDELLRNSVVGLQLSGADDNPVGIPQKICTNGFYLLRPGGTPQQSLSVRTNLRTAQWGHTLGQRASQELLMGQVGWLKALCHSQDRLN